MFALNLCIGGEAGNRTRVAPVRAACSGPLSYNPKCQEHGAATCAARRANYARSGRRRSPRSAYKLVPGEGLEPSRVSPLVSETSAFAFRQPGLNLVEKPGLEPGSRGCRPRALPLSYNPVSGDA